QTEEQMLKVVIREVRSAAGVAPELHRGDVCFFFVHTIVGLRHIRKASHWRAQEQSMVAIAQAFAVGERKVERVKEVKPHLVAGVHTPAQKTLRFGGVTKGSGVYPNPAFID